MQKLMIVMMMIFFLNLKKKVSNKITVLFKKIVMTLLYV